MVPHGGVTWASPFSVTAGKPAGDFTAPRGGHPAADQEETMRTTRIAALGVLLIVAAAGCGKTPAGDQIASAGGTPAASTSAAAGGGTDEKDAPLKFSQCMRDQGLTWFPDPEPVAGGLRIKVPEGTDKAKVDAATEACKKWTPGGGERGKIDPERLEQARQMAQCMRDNGVPNFPDPDADGGVRIDGNKLGTGPGEPAFDKADAACSKYRPDGATGHEEAEQG
jgi:hypothetical protein